ncbi:MAG TPA: glycosyltransferase family 9 protein [Candidatus Eisenbacteria bacterium]|nr:glycosyltransferase family 9 protein [Candidatus Eisenbacteria bacterium]
MERGRGSLKLLDRYAGIPVVAMLGVKPKRKHPRAFSSLGLLQTAAIGDTVLMAGILSDLRRSFPKVRIILFAGPSNYEIARLLAGPDEVVRLPVTKLPQAVRVLRGRRVDVLCDFGPWPRVNAICAALSGAGFLIGFETPGQYRHYVYDRTVHHSSRVHEVENQRALVRCLGVESKTLPRLAVDGDLPEVLAPNTYVAFHGWSAGYRGYMKEWPEEHWLALAEAVSSLGYEVVLTGGPADHDRAEALASRLKSLSGGHSLSFAGKTDLTETIRILKHAVAVVSVNTSVVHLAAAVGTPVVSINGPVNGTRWGPLGPNAVSVDSEGPDCGYLDLGFEYDGHRDDCMAAIKPDLVFETLMNLLRSRTGEDSQATG